MTITSKTAFAIAEEHYRGVPLLLLQSDGHVLQETYLIARMYHESASVLVTTIDLAPQEMLAQQGLLFLEYLSSATPTSDRLDLAFETLTWVAEWAQEVHRMQLPVDLQPTVILG